MPARSSSAALHTARLILDQYELTVIPRDELRGGISFIPVLTNSPEYLSIMIDWVSNVFRVANLRPEMKHWIELLHFGDPSAGQLWAFVNHMCNELELVPKDESIAEELPQWKPSYPSLVAAALPPPVDPDRRRRFEREAPSHIPGFKQTKKKVDALFSLSNASRTTVTYLFAYYRFRPLSKDFPTEYMMQMDVARIVEVGIGLKRAMPALPLAKQCRDLLAAGKLDREGIKAYFRKFSVLLEYVPNYRHHEEETKMLV